MHVLAGQTESHGTSGFELMRRLESNDPSIIAGGVQYVHQLGCASRVEWFSLEPVGHRD